MDKYKRDLPRPLYNQKMNDYLKEIGKLAGWDSLESKTLTKGGLRVTKTQSKFELMTTTPQGIRFEPIIIWQVKYRQYFNHDDNIRTAFITVIR